jgi:thioredoxin-like negative regulator of GroEL
LDRETYPNPKVVGLAKKLIPVKLDCDKDGPQRIAGKYKVEVVPTILFVDGTGKEVHKFVGFLPADKFTAEMQTALKKHPAK